MSMLDIGKNKAYEILHMFEAQGKLFKCGKTLRVRTDYFDGWLRQQEQRPQ